MVLPAYQNTNNMLVLNYISQLYNNNAIPRSVIQNIIENTSQLVTNLLDNVNSQSQPKNFNIPVLRNDPNYTESFKNFDTEFKRFCSLEKLQFLIKPKLFHIGQILDNVNTTSGVQIKMKNCEDQIIPIRIVLKKILRIAECVKQYIELHSKRKQLKQYL